jgi:hypothetical protein
MLETKLMNYVDIVPRLPFGTVFVSWADVLLFYDAEGVDFEQPGVTVFAHKGTVEYGCGHAVLSLGTEAATEAALSSSKSGTYECHLFMEKPSFDDLKQVGAGS